MRKLCSNCLYCRGLKWCPIIRIRTFFISKEETEELDRILDKAMYEAEQYRKIKA